MNLLNTYFCAYDLKVFYIFFFLTFIFSSSKLLDTQRKDFYNIVAV